MPAHLTYFPAYVASSARALARHGKDLPLDSRRGPTCGLVDARALAVNERAAAPDPRATYTRDLEHGGHLPEALREKRRCSAWMPKARRVYSRYNSKRVTLPSRAMDGKGGQT